MRYTPSAPWRRILIGTVPQNKCHNKNHDKNASPTLLAQRAITFGSRGRKATGNDGKNN